MITSTFDRKCCHPVGLGALLRQCLLSYMRKLWLWSCYFRVFKGGMGKSYKGQVMYFCLLLRYKSKWDQIKLTVLTEAAVTIVMFVLRVNCETVLQNVKNAILCIFLNFLYLTVEGHLFFCFVFFTLFKSEIGQYRMSYVIWCNSFRK